MAFGKSRKKTQKSPGEAATAMEKLPVAGAKARAARSQTSAARDVSESTSAIAHRKAEPAFHADNAVVKTPVALNGEPKVMAVAAGAGAATETLTHSRPTREQIAERAYGFFAERGFQHGFADQDWARAEAELSR